eukprot:4044531-Pleurochrysis_carterae.AAC.1
MVVAAAVVLVHAVVRVHAVVLVHAVAKKLKGLRPPGSLNTVRMELLAAAVVALKCARWARWAREATRLKGL